MAEIGGPVVNLSEDEIRLELLKLAHISLHEEYNFNREQQTWVWDSKVRNCLSNNTPVPEHPGYVSHPTDKDTVKRAKLFSEFIFSGK